jgi:hypothetical protein
MTGVLGGFLLAIGIVLVIATISTIDRDHDQFNSPWLWVTLLVGLGFAALGVVMMVF